MSTIILALGQYALLPKFCAIWGKMSRGKMSLGHFVLGHFVLGHFVFWGKMSLGKMSPSRRPKIIVRSGATFILIDDLINTWASVKCCIFSVSFSGTGTKKNLLLDFFVWVQNCPFSNIFVPNCPFLLSWCQIFWVQNCLTTNKLTGKHKHRGFQFIATDLWEQDKVVDPPRNWTIFRININ